MFLIFDILATKMRFFCFNATFLVLFLTIMNYEL